MVDNTLLDKAKKDDISLEYKPKYKIFQQLMLKRINKVLLVSSIYDNFILEEDGRLSDQIFEEFHSLNLRTIPNITRVSTASNALELLNKKKFDLIIMMRRLGDVNPFTLGQEIKKIQNIPVILLLNSAIEINLLPDPSQREGIDGIFLWNGDSSVFIAIIKHLEDKQNVDHDTSVGLVRVIIIVEDSIRFYSLFLPLFYSEIMKQTHRLIAGKVNDYYTLLQMRVRPKILLATNYEEAIEYYTKYKKYVIGIISDVSFTCNGKEDKRAGIKFITSVRKDDPTLPTAIQSSEIKNRDKAEAIGAYFIHKKSIRLLQNLRYFMLRYLGFGDFIFRLPNGTVVGKAKNLIDLYYAISVVPDESLVYHASINAFSGWLMNRAEFEIAQKLRPIKVSDFQTTKELRAFLLDAINAIMSEKTGGVVNDFSRVLFHPETRFIRLRPGSLGGKGRGIAFLQFLLNAFLLSDELAEKVSIRIPKTIVIGTSEFDIFLENNESLLDIALSDESTDDEIIKVFKEAQLSQSLKEDLRFILKHLTGPLSVRSSSLLEDSQYHPYAGIFQTYMLPNNQDIKTRLSLLCSAIKLVYASSYLKHVKSYAKSLGQTIEESKMAIVIQQVVGRQRKGNLSYPSFSGVASSYNYYPIAYMKPEDRIAFLAIGLGKTIVDGGLSFRFCPKYPEINFLSTEDQMLNNSQKYFYAIDLASTETEITKGEDSFLVRKSIFEADEHTLSNVADTYDFNDQVLRLGYSGEGAPIITFNRQLKYVEMPFARLLAKILDLGEKAMGSPVEIEFAGNFQTIPGKPTTFYLLQVRPYLEQEKMAIKDSETVSKDKIAVYSTKVSGNRIISDIKDLVYINPDTFDKLKTLDIVAEIDDLNKKFEKEKKPYILLGFGRWGTLDRFLGIPVKWNNISGVQVIIETGLKDFQIEHSQGSHFFQNITTANIGYFYVKYGSKTDFIDWEWLKKEELLSHETTYLSHIHLNKPFMVRIDGLKREGMIIKPDN